METVQLLESFIEATKSVADVRYQHNTSSVVWSKLFRIGMYLQGEQKLMLLEAVGE